MTDVYLTKNKYFDKDPVSQILFSSLLGESIVLAEGNDLWSRKRKVLSSAFYKDKLIKMTEQIREIVADKITEIERDHVETKQPMDIIKEIGDLQMRIILISAFGLHDLHKVKLPYLQNGQTRLLTIGDYLRSLTSFMIFRSGRYLFAVIPYMMFLFYSKEDREYKKNLTVVRGFIENLINERRENIEKFKDSVDLLTILVSDEYFSKNTSAMIDEIMVLFLAGSFTLKTTNSNLIQYLALNDKPYKKLMAEIKTSML